MVHAGTPFVNCVDIPCYNNSFLMTCNTSRYTENVVISNWLLGDENISNCSYTKDSHLVIDDCSVLIIRNVSPDTAGEYHCNVRDENQRILQGDPHMVDPPGMCAGDTLIQFCGYCNNVCTNYCQF